MSNTGPGRNRPHKRDPQGVHGALWSALGDDSWRQPADKPLTLASYSTGLTKTYFLETLAVGNALKPMPLFLTPSAHVPLPLEETYAAAYNSVPRRWRNVLDVTLKSSL